MVVDDHPAFRAVIKAMLAAAAWECIECQNGEEAVEKYAQIHPDLVLMDIAMDRVDGIRATELIKARFPAARIMILTQFDDIHLRAAADQAGACAYILKENLLGLPSTIEAQTPAVANGSIGSSNAPVI